MAEFSYFYVNHDLQKGKLWRGTGKIDVPEIFWFKNLSIPLTKDLQLLIFAMNQPWMSLNQFERFLGKKTAVANSSGFGDPNDPRANFVSKKRLNKPLPRLGKTYVFGGSIVRGTVKDDWLTVETIDVNKPIPKWDAIKNKRWLITDAIGVNEKGETYPLPYCGGHEVRFPVVSVGPVQVKLYNNIKDKPVPYLTRVVD